MGKSAVARVETNPEMPRIVLQNTRDLRERRSVVLSAIEAAEAEVERAEQAWNKHVREVAQRPAPAHSGGRSVAAYSHILRDELEAARDELAAQRDALKLLDSELAVYETPDRQAAAAAQRQAFERAIETYYAALEGFERVVKNDLKAALAKLFETRRAAAAVLGAETLGVAGDMAGDQGLRERLAEWIGGALAGQIDARKFAFYAGNGIVEARPWRDVEALHLNLNTENLE